MEDSKTVEKATKDKSSTAVKRKNVLKKLDLESAKLLASLKEKANKKSYGRKIKDNEIINAGLKLITNQEIKKLQESTYQEKDLLGICHEEYSRSTNSKLSVDQYLGKILRGEIVAPTKINLPE